MRVLIVTQYFWPEQFRVNDLAVDLVRRGHEVTVLTGEPTYPSRSLFPGYGGWRRRREDLAGVRVLRVPLLSRGSGQGWRLALNYLSFAASASLLGPALVPDDVDVIFVYEPSPVTVGVPAALLRRLRRAPVVFWVQDLWPETLVATGAVRSPVALAGLGRLVRWIYARCDRVLVESRGFVPHVLGAGVPAQRVSYLPNWAEDTYAGTEGAAGDSPAAADSTAAAPPVALPDGFRVMFAGNLGTAQALGTLVAAAELLRDSAVDGARDVQWVVLGDGRQRGWLAAEVARRGLGERVHLLGRWPVEDMPAFFTAADALLVTLQAQPSFAMTIPSKLQSYLAAGRPILGALDGEGAAVLQDSGAGLAVPAEDAHALAAAVLELRALSAAEREQLGAAGRRYFAEHFDRDRLLDDLEKTLLETARTDCL